MPDQEFIPNDPKDARNFHCGHGFPPLACPYQFCAIRRLVYDMQELRQYMAVEDAIVVHPV